MSSTNSFIPVAVAGHSLGEYSALIAAGSINFSDAVYLVRKRGEIMQDAVPAGNGTMVAVIGLPDQQLEPLIDVYKRQILYSLVGAWFIMPVDFQDRLSCCLADVYKRQGIHSLEILINLYYRFFC